MRDFTRDVGFGWPAYAWATLQKQTGKSPVYVAYLAQKSDTTVYAKGNRRGAAHADDMMYLKGAFDDKADKFPQEHKVSELMQQYWVNFAKTMNPNGAGLPQWPLFEADKPTVMQFNNGATLIPVPNQERIKLIDSFMTFVRTGK
jgi:para-nitrobenzyl esterase